MKLTKNTPEPVPVEPTFTIELELDEAKALYELLETTRVAAQRPPGSPMRELDNMLNQEGFRNWRLHGVRFNGV